MRCGLGVKAGWLIPFVDKPKILNKKTVLSVFGETYGWQVKLCDSSLTRAVLSAFEMSYHENALYKYPVFNFDFDLQPVVS